MEVWLLICLIILLLLLCAGYLFFRSKMKRAETHSHDSDPCMGAIRVTDCEGRDMLIIRKDDGSFEMHEEHSFRKQRT